MKRLYIAGPMTGYEDFNFPAFYEAANRLRMNSAFIVINPAELDDIYFAGLDKSKLDQKKLLKECITRDLMTIQQCDAIFMLKGWQYSKGARTEHALAEWLGLEIFYQ